MFVQGLAGKLAIQEGTTNLGHGAFMGCRSINQVELPRSLRIIGPAAFCGCGITGTLTIPEALIRGRWPGTTEIGDMAFEGCTAIQSLHLPLSLRVIGNSAFSGCTGIRGTLKIPDGTTEIRSGAFAGCRSITALELPRSLRTISEATFRRCRGQCEIALPTVWSGVGEGEAVRGPGENPTFPSFDRIWVQIPRFV